MRVIGTDINRVLRLDIPDNDCEIEYENGLPVTYTMKDGLVLTCTYDEDGVLQTVENQWAKMTLTYNDYGQLVKTEVEEK